MEKICIQGIEGSYSFEASNLIQKKIKTNLKSEFCINFDEVFQKIKKCKLAVVPIDNTIAGSVLGVVNMINKHNCEILLEFSLEIKHCLLAKKESNKVDSVYSHYQALAQCSNFLNRNKIISNVFSNTANAAKYISQKNDLNVGAISSEICAKLYNLKILEKNIQNEKNNYTRFFLIKKKNSKFSFEKKLKKNKIAIYFTTKHIPSSLYKSLGGFATHNVNLTKLESLPFKVKKSEYPFFIDFLGNLEDKNIKESLKELKFFSNELKILGNYEKF